METAPACARKTFKSSWEIRAGLREAAAETPDDVRSLTKNVRRAALDFAMARGKDAWWPGPKGDGRDCQEAEAALAFPELFLDAPDQASFWREILSWSWDHGEVAKVFEAARARGKTAAMEACRERSRQLGAAPRRESAVPSRIQAAPAWKGTWRERIMRLFEHPATR